MRILFISTHFPENLSTSVYGIYKRMNMLLDAVKEVAQVHMLLYVQEDKCKQGTSERLEEAFLKHWGIDVKVTLCKRAEFKEDTEIQKWLSLARGVFSFYKQRNRIEYSGKPQVDALEKCLDHGTDVVIAHRLSSMCPLLLSQRELPPVFFDMDDVEHVVLERYLKNRKNLRSNLLTLLIPALIRGEQKAVKLARKTFVCSEEDRKYLEEKFNLPGITVVPNAVSVPKLEELTTEPNILFLASDYDPNIQAAEFLVKDIWPRIKEQVPEANLVIAGISEDKLNLKSGSVPGLELPGFVEDLDKLYKETRVTIVPMLVGGGTRFKIVESAMYARPTVSTSVGAEGIELSEPNEIIIEDKPESIALACIELLKDYELSVRIGLVARKKAQKLYDRRSVVDSLRMQILDGIK